MMKSNDRRRRDESAHGRAAAASGPDTARSVACPRARSMVGLTPRLLLVALLLSLSLPAVSGAADDTLRPRISAFVLASPGGIASGGLVQRSPTSGGGFNHFHTAPIAGTTLDGRIRAGFGAGARLELSPVRYLRIAPFVQVEYLNTGVSSLLTDLGLSLLPTLPIRLGPREGALYLSIASGLSVGRVTIVDDRPGGLGFTLQAGVGLSVSVSDGTSVFVEAGWLRRQLASDVGSARFEVVTNQAFVRVGVTL